MALIIKDRIKEGTTTTGTGDITLAGTTATFKAFSSALSDGDTTYYAIAHTASGVDEWEVGIGTYTVATNSISRDTIIEGSNASSPVNLSAGVKNIFITYPSDKAVYVDTSGKLQPTTTLMNTIKANDGVGSTLDADLLDGQHGFYYTNYVNTAISNLVDTAPATLNTLNELAAALGDDPNFATTVTNSIATKLPLAGGTMTGNLSFGDDVKANFGAGSDLQIFHSSSLNANYILGSATQSTNISGTPVNIQTSQSLLTLNGAVATVQGNDQVLLSGATVTTTTGPSGVVLDNNGSTKLATTATGIDVTGTVTADGGTLTGHLYLSNYDIYNVNNFTFNDPGPNEGISWTGGNMKIYESPDDLTTNTAGNLQFVYGTTRRLTVNNTGIDVNGTVTAPIVTIGGILLENSTDRSGLLEITRLGTSSYAGIQANFSATALWSFMGSETTCGLYDDANSDWILQYTENAGITLNYNAATKLTTTSTGATTTGTHVADTFNATAVTGGGFQGIDADTALIPSFTWTSDVNTGMWHAAADAIGFTTGGTNQMTITTTGTTTVGTAIADTFNATSTVGGGFQGIDADTALVPSFTWTADLDTGMYRATTNSIGWTTAGTNRLTLSTSALTSTVQVNATTFNATSTTGGGFQGIDADTAAVPSFTWSSDLDTGMWRTTTNSIGFTTGGVNRITINSAGISGAGVGLTGVLSVGVTQTWKVVSRAANTNYQNTTGRAIMIGLSLTGASNRVYCGATTATYVELAFNNAGGSGVNEQYSVTFIVPSTWYWKYSGNKYNATELS